MAKQTNITLYQCDRCQNSQYVSEQNAVDGEWREVQHSSADATLVKRLLCEQCFGLYRDMATRQDAEFYKFMKKEN